MAISDLKSDVKANIDEVIAMGVVTELGPDAKAILQHLQMTLWPTLDALIDHVIEHERGFEEVADELEELGEAVDDLTEGRGTVLMKDDAAVFALVITGARELITSVRSGKAMSAEQIAGLEAACNAGEKLLTETTINVDLDDQDDDSDDEEDDDGDDD